MAVLERPDMPKAMFDIPGLNPWNILLIFIFFGWLFNRKKEGLKWDMPAKFNWLLFIYFLVIIVGYFRLVSNTDNIETYYSLFDQPLPGSREMFVDYIVNTIKWAIPGLLIFDGCREKQRLKWALGAIILLYIIIALQVLRWMPLSVITDGDILADRSRRVLNRQIGYYRTDIAMMLAGAAWAIFSAKYLYDTKKSFRILNIFFVIDVLGLILTGGRTGYATFFVIGLTLTWYKWRKLLIVLPVGIAVIVLLLPAAFERFTQGFSVNEEDIPETNYAQLYTLEQTDSSVDLYTITAGRAFTWPFSIEKIKEAPFIGYGREGMKNNGLSVMLTTKFNSPVGHPHNAYLQLLMDTGLLGALPIFLFYFLLVRYSLTLLKNKDSVLLASVGGFSLSNLLALLIASVGAQSFYPVESSVGVWCSIGLLLRVYIDKEKFMQ